MEAEATTAGFGEFGTGVWRAWFDRYRRFADATWQRDCPVPGWHTPNRVVREHAAYRVRDFSVRDATGAAGHRPVLIVPPEVNSSAIADFGEGQSLVGGALDAGFERVGAVEWLSATRATRDRDVDDSLETILEGIEALGGPAHLIGLCQGGWEALMVAALCPDRVASLTLVAAPVDFHAGLGTVNLMAQWLPMSVYQALVAAGGGVMRGAYISQGFDSLLPFERFWLKYVTLWNHLDQPAWMDRFHQLNDWYRSPKDLPGPMYLRAVRELFKENRLIHKRFVAFGQTVDLGRVRCPVALVAGSKDHITPSAQVFAARKYVGSRNVLQRLLDAGHVGTFMSHGTLARDWPSIFAWLRGREREQA